VDADGFWVGTAACLVALVSDSEGDLHNDFRAQFFCRRDHEKQTVLQNGRKPRDASVLQQTAATSPSRTFHITHQQSSTRFFAIDTK